LGEFLGDCLLWVNLDIAKMFGLPLTRSSLCINFEKDGLGFILADIFCTNSSGHPGVDVMITIFCDFCQFSAKKLAFFSKTNVMIQFLHNLALF
jgi:hypothetical protein